MEDYNKTIEKEYEDLSTAKLAVLFMLLGALFLPGLLVAIFIYFMFFRILKWKPSVTGIVIALMAGIWLILFLAVSPHSKFVLIEPKTWISLYIFISTIVGILGGFGFILWQARQLQTYPELKVLKGWAESFEYAKTPWEKIFRKRLINGCKLGYYNTYESAPMGVLEGCIHLNNGVTYDKTHVVSRMYSEAYKSTLIAGNTGSGKTFTMMNLMRNDILAGYPICVIDFKKGPDLAYHLSKWAYENGRPFYHFTSGAVGSYKNPYCQHQASYDPLSTGNATSKADMVLGLREWDTAADVYKQQTISILQAVFYLLEHVNRDELPKIPWEDGGIAQFVAALKVENLFDMIEWLKKDMMSRHITSADKRKLEILVSFYRSLTEKRSTLREQVLGLQTICRTLIMSSYSDWLTKGETPNHINLFEIATSKQSPVVLFQFNPNAEPEFSKYMGNILMNDLGRAAAYKNSSGDQTPFGLYIDEFQTLNPASIAGLIEKVRSAKFFTTLSSQSPEQIVKASTSNGAAVLSSIFDTVSNFIVHAGSTQDTAEKFSKLVGETAVTKYKVMGKRTSSMFSVNWSNSRSSMVNTVKENEYKLPPSDLQDLDMPGPENNYKSTAIYITKACAEPGLSNLSQVVSRRFVSIVQNDLLEQVPEDFRRNLLAPAPVERKKIRQREIVQSATEPLLNSDICTDEQSCLQNDSRVTDNSLNPTDTDLIGDEHLSDKEFKEKHTRESLEKAGRRQTSFDDIMNGKKRESDKFTLPKLD